jgi:ferric-dicitrate binding protein FerR (iron transport regulator)
VEDPAAANLQIGGNFQALDVESFVAALGRSFGIRATQAHDGTLILARTADAARN